MKQFLIIYASKSIQNVKISNLCNHFFHHARPKLYTQRSCYYTIFGTTCQIDLSALDDVGKLRPDDKKQLEE